MKAEATETTCAECRADRDGLRRCCGSTYYCNVQCQKAHRKVHKRQCEKKPLKSSGSKKDESAATSSGGDEFDSFADESDIDIDAFEFPPRSECPICMLPLPLDKQHRTHMLCCGKRLCRACIEEAFRTAANFGGDAGNCAFCRQMPPKTEEEEFQSLRALIGRGDGEAAVNLAWKYLHGLGVAQDKRRAVELYHQATRAGSAKAAAWLADRYLNGNIVGTDRDKAKRLYARAARLGNFSALYNLGAIRLMDGNAGFMRYFLVSASAGCQEALDAVKAGYKANTITRDEFEKALRSFQAANDELRSENRDKFIKNLASGSTLDDLAGMMSHMLS